MIFASIDEIYARESALEKQAFSFVYSSVGYISYIFVTLPLIILVVLAPEIFTATLPYLPPEIAREFSTLDLSEFEQMGEESFANFFLFLALPAVFLIGFVALVTSAALLGALRRKSWLAGLLAVFSIFWAPMRAAHRLLNGLSRMMSKLSPALFVPGIGPVIYVIIGNVGIIVLYVASLFDVVVQLFVGFSLPIRSARSSHVTKQHEILGAAGISRRRKYVSEDYEVGARVAGFLKQLIGLPLRALVFGAFALAFALFLAIGPVLVMFMAALGLLTALFVMILPFALLVLSQMAADQYSDLPGPIPGWIDAIIINTPDIINAPGHVTAMAAFIIWLAIVRMYRPLLFLIRLGHVGAQQIAVSTVNLAANLNRTYRLSFASSLEKVLRADNRAPILFLRSFIDDDLRLMRPGEKAIGEIRSDDVILLEEVIAAECRRFGPLIGVYNPNLKRKTLGAAKVSLSSDEWQEHILNWLEKSSVICLVLGSSPSLNWEIEQIVTHGHLEKTVFVIPPSFDSRRLISSLSKGLGSSLSLGGQGDDERKIIDSGLLMTFSKEQNDFLCITGPRDGSLAYELATHVALRHNVGL